MNLRTLGLAGAALGGLLTLAVLPALLTPATQHPSQCRVIADDGHVGVILAAIRRLESGDNYHAIAPGSTASGAYQFIDSTWGRYAGYARAHLAPATVQDAKAAEHVASILAANGNDLTAIPVAWYLGHVPPPASPAWDTVPAPYAGNRLTPRQYQARWMELYRTMSAGHEGPAEGGPDASAASDCSSGGEQVLAGGWALPGPRQLLEATRNQIDDPHHDYPAWDWSIPTGTPIYAIRGGTVVGTATSPMNCAGQRNCQACGLGVTIADDQGSYWTYCHGSAQHLQHGETVIAGQQILTSGNTGNSTGPHLHLAITAGGVRRCPQPLIASLYERGVGLDPLSLPAGGCSY